jgi:4-amino-4-deoxy-L-arabinose transferase-like glycosyltransferase
VNESALGLKERRLYCALAAMLACLWLVEIAGRPLFNPDEGRYAEIPREMLASGDWIIPHLNGLAYAEKPPLQYWATAFCYRLFGVSEFAARLYGALAALGTVTTLWLLARAHAGERAAWRAAAILAGMLLFAALGHLVTLDMGLTFYLTLSMAGFLLAQRQQAPDAKAQDAKAPTASRRWMLLAWVAAALGVLSKGIVAAFIPAAVLILHSLWTRDFSAWRRLQPALGLPLFLLITVPWHWLAARRDGDFLEFYFVHEHVARYLTPIAQRVEPWWFFIAVLVAGSAPWTYSALRVLVTGWRHERATGFDARSFVWVWVLFVLVFFSLSDSKLMPYILPIMPALALLIALSPPQTLRRDCLVTAIFTLLAGVALGAASLHWPQLVASSARADYLLPLSKAAAKIAALFAVTGAFVLVQAGRDATRAGVFLGVGWCLAWMLLDAAAIAVAPIYSGALLAVAIPQDARQAPIYSIATYDQSAEFYLRRAVTLVHFRGELDYGLNKNPGAGVADLQEFASSWSAAPQAFAIMEPSMFELLQDRGVPLKVIGRSADRLVAARR